MLTGKYQTLHEQLQNFIPANRIFTDPTRTLAWGSDASFYRLIPKIVIKANTEEEVAKILQCCHHWSVPATFRAAGTSLSGQAISDSVLIVAAGNWKRFEILDQGHKIRLQPGIIGARANMYLAPFGRKIGPDPASINAAMIGGIAANNASGMCCGTAQNSYNTLDSLRLVMVDGTMLDTACQESKKAFAQSHGHILDKLSALAQTVRANPTLSALIREKYKMKNTTGYSLNALVDFLDPFDILTHLMIGSEGTLAFMSEITYHTVADHAYKASALIIFPDIEQACLAVSLLKSQPVAAVELMDRSGLRSVQNNEGMPSYLKDLSDDAAALLVETRAQSQQELDTQIKQIFQILEPVPVVLPIRFTGIPSEYMVFWNIRKGLFPSVGAMRKTGTTCLIEDVAFPVEQLAKATLDLQALFRKYHYHEAVIFGHALEGNLHFVFNQDFGPHQEIERYARFMEELASLVVDRYGGALKAEHGTGRNMAPFVEKEWGSEAFALMKQIKAIFDPLNLLNPGVILNESPTAHLENLKPLAPVNELVDKCIECGFCEPVCVSADLTLSPRQRIVVLREMERLNASGHQPHLLAEMARDFDYEGDQTCATDGLCAINCPVNIDTGAMIKSIRYQKLRPVNHKIAWRLSRNTAKVVGMASLGLDTVSLFHRLLGTKVLNVLAHGAHKISGGLIPAWNPWFPAGGKRIHWLPVNPDNPLKVVYFPSCVNRGMGISRDYEEKIPLTDKIPTLLRKAGFEVIYPKNLRELCCGMAYSSKGYKEQGKFKSDQLQTALMHASDQGRYPILCDMSPCLYTMKTNMEPALKLFEPIEFSLQYLAEHLEFTPIDQKIAIFSVCSAKKMGLDAQMAQLASMCSTHVTEIDANCCGFAGDRGFSYPELNAHGLRSIIEQTSCTQQGYSTSRTCEIGLSLHSEKSFQSILYLVDQATRPKAKEQKRG